MLAGIAHFTRQQVLKAINFAYIQYYLSNVNYLNKNRSLPRRNPTGSLMMNCDYFVLPSITLTCASAFEAIRSKVGLNLLLTMISVWPV